MYQTNFCFFGEIDGYCFGSVDKPAKDVELDVGISERLWDVREDGHRDLIVGRVNVLKMRAFAGNDGSEGDSLQQQLEVARIPMPAVGAKF